MLLSWRATSVCRPSVMVVSCWSWRCRTLPCACSSFWKESESAGFTLWPDCTLTLHRGDWQIRTQKHDSETSKHNEIPIFTSPSKSTGTGRRIVGGRQDRETGAEDRRTRIQRDETGNVVGDRQGREAGTGDRRTRIQKDETGNVVRTGRVGKPGTGDRRIAGETCMNLTAKTIWQQVNSVQPT